MHSATITLRDLTTGAGIAGLTVTLRGPADNYTANLYTATGVAGKPGAYEFVGVVFGKYKLFVNGVEDKTFGGDNGRYFPVSDMTDIALCLDGDNYNALDKKITNVASPTAGKDAVNKESADASYDPVGSAAAVAAALGALIAEKVSKSGDTMSGTLNMSGNKIENLPTPTGISDPATKGYSDSKYLNKQDPVSQQVYSVPMFRTQSPFVHPTAVMTNINQLATIGWIKQYFQSLINGEVTVYQQSENIARVLYSGANETNQVFLSINLASIFSQSVATVIRQMLVLIEGNGVNDQFPVNYHNYLEPANISDYVHIAGINRTVLINLREDTYSANYGRTVISNCTLDNLSEDATTLFENIIFINCKFQNSHGAGATMTFTNCDFVSGCENRNITNFTTSNCRGTVFDMTTSMYKIIGGIQHGSHQILSTEGYLSGKRILGTLGSNVASGSFITLGDGNYFFITGTTNIEYISNVGWTAGSIIHLEFSGTLDLIHELLPTQENEAGISLKAGTDLTVSNGSFISLFLNSDKTFWREI